MIYDLLRAQYSLNHNDIELACKSFTDIIISAAKSSLSVSNNQKSRYQDITRISPILLYCSEIWIAFDYVDFDKWDKCDIQRSHLDFCRRIFHARQPKAYFNICTGGAFAPPGPLLAPPLRKNCPTSDWAHLKKLNFMTI